MARTLGLRDLGVIDASAWTGATTQLLRAGRPLLATARLTGGVVSLGRYQRAESVLTEAGRHATIIRRATGGRAIALGEGLLAIALGLPHRSWLVDDAAEGLPTSKLLNRGVRGILAGLGALGVGAYYFGRDFVTVDSAQAGYLSFDVTESGALVECVLPTSTHWWLPPELDGLPPRPPARGIPGPGLVPRLDAVTSAALLEALAGGYAERFGLACALDDGELPPPAVIDAPARARWSPLHPVPIGFVEAGADVSDGVITGASFCGDFEADSAGVLAAERALVGARPTLADIGPRLNGVYGHQRHTVLGVTDLTVWADALIEACAA